MDLLLEQDLHEESALMSKYYNWVFESSPKLSHILYGHFHCNYEMEHNGVIVKCFDINGVEKILNEYSYKSTGLAVEIFNLDGSRLAIVPTYHCADDIVTTLNFNLFKFNIAKTALEKITSGDPETYSIDTAEDTSKS